jgi:hypothetical protein
MGRQASVSQRCDGDLPFGHIQDGGYGLSSDLLMWLFNRGQMGFDEAADFLNREADQRQLISAAAARMSLAQRIAVGGRERFSNACTSMTAASQLQSVCLTP